MKRAVVLASGSGTNFQHVLDCAAAGRLALDVRLLVCNSTTAHAIVRAQTAGIEVCVLPWDRGAESRGRYDDRLIDVVKRAQPEVVLLLGWMHILPPRFFERIPAPINIHPAYLPLDPASDTVEFPDGTSTPVFRGAHAVDDAFAAGVSWIGATCHLVTPDVDRGPVLAREPLAILPGEAKEAAFARLRPVEYRVLEAGIDLYLRSAVPISKGA